MAEIKPLTEEEIRDWQDTARDGHPEAGEWASPAIMRLIATIDAEKARVRELEAENARLRALETWKSIPIKSTMTGEDAKRLKRQPKRVIIDELIEEQCRAEAAEARVEELSTENLDLRARLETAIPAEELARAKARVKELEADNAELDGALAAEHELRVEVVRELRAENADFKARLERVREWIEQHSSTGGRLRCKSAVFSLHESNKLREAVRLPLGDGYDRCPRCGSKMLIDQDETYCSNRSCPQPRRLAATEDDND